MLRNSNSYFGGQCQGNRRRPTGLKGINCGKY